MNKSFAFVDNFPFTIAAGDSLSVAAGSWDYFYLASLSGGDLLAEGAAFRVPLILGRQIRVNEPETGTITLTNRGDSDASGVIYAGSGDIEDRGVVGSVSVTNFPGSPKWSEEGFSYSAFIFDSGVAAKYSHVQLWNPSSNTKRVVVNGLSAYQQLGSRAAILFGLTSTKLASVVSSYGEVNKLSGSAISSGVECRAETVATPVGMDVLLLRYGEDEELIGTEFKEPVIIEPGWGLIVRASAVNASVGGNFQYHAENV